MCMWKAEVNLVFHVLSALFFEIGSFHETWSSQIKFNFLASESLGFSWFCISKAGIKETDYNA